MYMQVVESQESTSKVEVTEGKSNLKSRSKLDVTQMME